MKTPSYKIIFGKDPEYLEDELGEDIWPDKYEKTVSFKHKYVAGEFVTDDIDIFLDNDAEFERKSSGNVVLGCRC